MNLFKQNYYNNWLIEYEGALCELGLIATKFRSISPKSNVEAILILTDRIEFLTNDKYSNQLP